MKENCVENRIVKAASTPIDTKLNLVQFKREKIKALTHKQVCEAVVDYKKSNPYYPFYAIMMMGVGSNSFKNSEFDKGYKKFDKEKADTTFEMSRAYMQKMGIDGQMPNDVVWRICGKFYDNMSKNIDVFKSVLAQAKVMEYPDNREYFKELCENLQMWW